MRLVDMLEERFTGGFGNCEELVVVRDERERGERGCEWSRSGKAGV